MPKGNIDLSLVNSVYVNEYEVARITGRSVSTLRNQRCRCEGMPYYKIGRSVRYLLSEVYEYMEANRVEIGKF